MESFVHQSRVIPIWGVYDVVVAGGGVAGIIAATAAARNGAKTAHIERYGFLGGTATAGMVTPISEFKKNGRQIIGGIPWEFAQRLGKLNGAILDYSNGAVPFDQECYKLAAQQMELEAGVELLLHSYLTAVIYENQQIRSVIIENKSGAFAIKGKVFIDCTGDADVAYMAGVPMQDDYGGQMQPMTLWFKLGGVNTEKLPSLHLDTSNKRRYNKDVSALLTQKKEAGLCGNFGGPWFITAMRDSIININITRMGADASNWQAQQKAELQLREDMFNLVRILKEDVDGFQNAYLLESGTQAGIRETRRIKGVFTVPAEDILEAVHYEDSICMGAHCIDMHRASDQVQDVRFLDAPYYIPYRCMITAEYDNLLVAGRCVSADHRAFGSMRVQAPCMAEGHAAGCAAAICARNGHSVHDINIPLLRQTLAQQGAIL